MRKILWFLSPLDVIKENPENPSEVGNYFFLSLSPCSVIWGWICYLTVTASLFLLNAGCYLSTVPLQEAGKKQQRYSISNNIACCLVLSHYTYENIIRMENNFTLLYPFILLIFFSRGRKKRRRAEKGLWNINTI